MATLKISMACWMVADEAATRRKVAAATGLRRADGDRRRPVRDRRRAAAAAGLPRPVRRHGRRRGSSAARASPTCRWRRGRSSRMARRARARGAVRARQEARRRLRRADVDRRADRAGPALAGRRARCELVVEARESAQGVGLFDDEGKLDSATRRPLRRGVRPGHRDLRGAQQAEPVRAARPFRPAGAALPTSGSRSCCGSRSTGAGLHSDAFGNAEPAAGDPWRAAAESMRGTVVIDCFPESAARYREGHAIVAVDVIRATTTAITAVAGGRRCFPVPTVEAAHAARRGARPPAARRRAGRRPSRTGSTSTTARSRSWRTRSAGRPIVLLSTSGTRLCTRPRRAGPSTWPACATHVPTARRAGGEVTPRGR